MATSPEYLDGSTIVIGLIWYEVVEATVPTAVTGYVELEILELAPAERLRLLCTTVEVAAAEGEATVTTAVLEDGEMEDTGFGSELKFEQVPRFRCSEAVRDGFDAENKALHKEHRSLTALGRPVSGLLTSMGSR
uniref:Uncharacterized protein MANES_01G072200 n=1 Tax=Rhizophora mucronata TaxID=61149 RepID=A0A2P2KCZ0_RHIMU